MSQTPKTCQICAEDCSDRPRVRDTKGRYYCRACAEAMASPPDTLDRPADIDLDEPIGPDDPVSIEPDRSSSRGVCPSCYRPLPPDTGVCVTCSQATKPRKGDAAPTCQKCGYDLTGARSLICPECGTTQSRQRAKNIDMSREVVRDAYLKPAIALILGLTAIIAFQFAIGNSNSIPEVLLAVLVQSVVGLVIFWICSVVWIGFDEPFHINVIRLLGIYSISWAVLLMAMSLPPLFCSAIIFVPAGIFALLHKKMLDLDMPDAALVSVVTGIVWVAVVLVVLS